NEAAGGGAGDAPQYYRPEGLPDHLAGKDDRETIDKLYKAFDGFRQQQGKKGVPETPDGYELTLADDIKDKVLRPGEDGKDPLFEAMKPIAHKYGLSKDAFSAMAGELYQAVAALTGGGGDPAAAAGEGIAADFDFKSLGGAEKAAPMIEGATVWLNGLKQSGAINDAVAKELQLLTTYAEGVQALNALRGLTGEKTIPANTGGDNAPDQITEEMIEQRWADPKSWRQGEIDDEFVAETRRMSAKLWSGKK
ncbi:MAG TPA: hypothetical protein PLW48_03830, partial [Alphaproteobacteria bacterium]|nr:hypothetical protein [Alphaproteobacteria bacterium]